MTNLNAEQAQESTNQLMSEPEQQAGERLVTLHPVPDVTEQTTIKVGPDVGAESDAGPTGHDARASVAQTTEDNATPGEAEPSVDVREQARTVWRESASAGQPLTGHEVGARFGRSERWGRARIAEARNEDGRTNTGTPSGRPARRRPRAGTRTSGTSTAAATAGERPATVPPQTAPALPEPGSTPRAGSDEGPHDTPAQLDQPVPEAHVPMALPAGARLVAWAGFVFGTVISVAANVLHAWLPALAHQAPAPGLAPQVGAAVWPIALVISVEVLSRVPWRPGWTWRLARYGGAGVVAVGAAIISYGHLHGVLAAWGYGTTGAAVGPFVVDGLMTISGFALLAMSNHGNGKAVG